MGEQILTSRQAGDIFWTKKKRYILSAMTKNASTDSYFHPDMAAEVSSCYENNDLDEKTYLTGTEFNDTPPTGSDLNNMAASIGSMMRFLDTLKEKEEKSEEDEKKAALIEEIITAFFTGCGVDREGTPFKDRDKRDAARKEFMEKRVIYEEMIQKENRLAGRKLISDLRAQNGILERMNTGITPEDPRFDDLVAAHAEEAAHYSEAIQSLRNGSIEAILESDGRGAALEAFTKIMFEMIQDPSIEIDRKRLLADAYADHRYEIKEMQRQLLYKKMAAYYELDWILEKKPVDTITAEKIREFYDVEPGIMDQDIKFCDLPGFVPPEEKQDYELPDEEISTIFSVAEEVKTYIFDHLDEFESQSLMSAITWSDERMTIMVKAWKLVRAIEQLSLAEDFKSMDAETKLKLFSVWLMSELVNRIGYTMVELVMENAEKTVGEVTEIFRNHLGIISYSELERTERKNMGLIFGERGGIDVSGQENP